MKKLVIYKTDIAPITRGNKDYFVIEEEQLHELMKEAAKFAWTAGGNAERYTQNPEDRPYQAPVTFADWWARKMDENSDYKKHYDKKMMEVQIFTNVKHKIYDAYIIKIDTKFKKCLAFILKLFRL